jgi:hypothetical protein
MTPLRYLALVAAVGCASAIVPTAASAAGDTAGEQIVSPDHLREIADVRDVTVDDDGTVSGVVVNRSGHVLKDVRLLIDSQWLWNNEFRPGTDSPGRAVYITLREEIPPRGSARFTYRPEEPLPRRSDGRFVTSVRVHGLTEVETPSTASAY